MQINKTPALPEAPREKEDSMNKSFFGKVGMVVCLVAVLMVPAIGQGEEITAYLATTPPIVEGFAKLVKEKTGVDIKYRFLSCGAMNAKLRAEAPNFEADMGIFVCIPETFMAKKEGWLVEYDSPAWSKVPKTWGVMSPATYIDPDNTWYNTNVYGFVLVANKEMIEKRGYKMPESWDDLLDPKWKGQIVMPSPLASGTAFQMLYTFITHYAFNQGKPEEEAWKFIEALDKNIHHYTASGGSPTELVGRGEFMLGITTDQNVLTVQRQGYPLVSIIPKEGIGYEGIYAFILKGTKKYETAKKVIDFLATDEFNGYMADLGYVTRLPHHPSALYGKIPQYVPNVDHMWAIENKTRILNKWKDKFLRK
jgi:iron(III) transport system substrate-binding protein